MKIRFQADVDLNEDIVRGVLRREPAVDFQTASFAGLRRLSDLEVLAHAATDGRVLVSHDRKTMPHNFAEFVRTKTSPGLFIVSQRTDVLAAVEDLLLVWSASEAEEWINRVCTIPL